MSTHEDLLATIRYVRDRTGDPNAWQTGLTPTEVTAVVTSTTRSEQLDAILRKIRQRHSNLYYPAPPDREQGDAARAIADAEAALAHQNSATAQLDLQVVSAILNAHLKTVEGGESLHELQQEIEAAVRIRSDLDTPAGARDFQRFLIGKLKDIREVVATASLDAASKSALMAAWTSLYDASKGDRGDADDRGPASVGSGGAPARGAGQQPELPTRAEPDCLLDSLLLEDPGLLADDLQVPGGTSAAIPTFSSSLDCTTRVIGGLWPAELSSNTAETATLAEHLKADLHRIVGSANDELMVIWRAGMADSTRRAEEDRVIDRARASAMRRVESAMRELRQITGRVPVEIPRMRGAGGSDLDTTRLMPAVTVVQPADQACTDWPVAAAEDDEARLQRLLAFVARQEPRLNWAVGVHADGTTVLVTDVAHGWIPPGIALPEGVRLLAPARRAGRAPELVGITTCCKTYTPGDSLRRAVDSTAPTSSVQPRALPAIAGLSVELGIATQRHDGLPKIVHAMATAAGNGAAAEEVDLLRVHVDTALHHVLAQYPRVDPALLLNCMLLAATERSVTGDPIAANYHFAWFRELDSRR